MPNGNKRYDEEEKRDSMRRIVGLIIAVLAVASAAEAQTNPCRSAGASIILKPSLRFVGEFDDHNATIPGQPTQFVTTKYRLKVYDATAGNPTTGPFVMTADVPRAQMSVWPDTTPLCYVSPSLAIPATVKPWAALRAYVTPVSGEGASENEAVGAQAPDPFVLGQLRSSAVRVLAVP
jgi:hypothetical protein